MKTYRRSFKNYLIDRRFQSKYLFLTITLLLAYTLIFTAVLFLPSILTLQFDYNLVEKNQAARTLLVLHRTVWPTVGVVILLLGILSIFLTHKIAGPVYRLRCAISDLISGNLDTRIHLRRWDDLQELADQVNQLSEELKNYIQNLKEDHELLARYIDNLEEELTSKGICQESEKKLIQQLKEQKRMIAERLERFKSQS